MLTKMQLPDGYYYEGEANSHCHPMNSLPNLSFKYCEDASFWENYKVNGKLEERRVVVSCDSGRREWNTVLGPLLDPTPRGSLWIYSSKLNKTARLTLENFPDERTFHPLGVEVYPSYSGNASYMYVVNHAANETAIEQFLVSPSSSVATHIRTLSHPFFIASNALALTSPTSFYVTNDHVFTKRLPYIGAVVPMVETIFGIPLSFTAHVTVNPDETAHNAVLSHTIVAPFVAYSNGISISPSGLEVAIASTSIGTVYFYSRNTTTNALTFSTSVKLPFPPDNVKHDHDGNLIVGGHPHFPSLLQLLENKVDVAPSWVASISPLAGNVLPEYDLKATLSASTIVSPPNNHTVQTLFQSNGNTFPTSSSGLLDTLSGNLYVTGLYAEEGAMICHP
ncbi:arylesterase [Lentinula aciculospora]|uniref:Arylesterase n=1 Tax=Lentinula aciculospora TaxID=153920 RepID=A0A9W9A7C7_9AGAR|nr:arylesterase [Lentinula aciculospora]